MTETLVIGPDEYATGRIKIRPGMKGALIIFEYEDEPPPAQIMPPGTLFVDVSYAQGLIDWPTLRHVGKVSHAAIRVSQGLTISDAQFPRNWPGAKAVGVQRAAYHLLETRRSGMPVGMESQARKFADSVGSDLPESFWSMDYEPGTINQPHASEADIESFIATLAGKAGGRPIVDYTSQGMWPGYTRYEKTWAADYTPPLDAIRGLPKPSAWQIGVTKLPGIVGWVDVNMWVEGLENPVIPKWAYKRTPKDEKSILYFCRAKQPTVEMEFYDAPNGKVHTRRAAANDMSVFRITLDGQWVCVVEGSSQKSAWWCRMDDVVVL